MRVKLLFSTIFIFLYIIFLGKNESLALAIQDSTLTSSQIASINQIRAVGLQTVGSVIVWNQAGDPGDCIMMMAGLSGLNAMVALSILAITQL